MFEINGYDIMYAISFLHSYSSWIYGLCAALKNINSMNTSVYAI